MKVWVVIESWDEGHEDPIFDHNRIVGVYDSEEKARAIQERLINDNAPAVIAGTEYPIDVTVDECEVY